MRIVILGSGVIGISSAYYLALAGHEVTVIDRQPGPALETSFANAGQISPGYASPWAAPGVPLKAIKWMLQRHAPLSIKPDGSAFQLQWMWQMLRNCTSARYAINKERMVRLAEYSRDCLKLLREQTGIAYEGRQRGTLQLFRTERQLENAARDIRVLRDAGVKFELLTGEQIAQAEPALGRVSGKLAGALRLPNDETGDCHLFSTRLAAMAAALGVRFRHHMAIDLLAVSGDSVDCVLCGDEVVHADAFVVALGAQSTTVLRPIMNIPVYPIKGYSITLPIVDAGAAPVSTVLDETYKVAVTRFEERIRVGGMAELAGFDARLDPRRRATLEMVVNDLFPGAGDSARASFWTGLRPMTPDGTPLIGRAGLRNLYLNTGHGTLGWTMACGSAQLLADIISARRPAIAYADLGAGRYRRSSVALHNELSFHSRKVST